MTHTQFVKKVLTWFEQHGRQDLPWQHPINAYRVWVSEIMLQQTQVKTVLPYFKRFMKQFPNVKQLALASDDAVLAAWSGLGYYARARNLHKTAQHIWYQHRGRFPKARQALEQLPGIGRSTAAAICAICYDQAEPILDGNVKRVLARYFAVTDPVESRLGLQALWRHAEQLMPNRRCAAYTQAMMDLGAMVCLPNQPNCLQCPIRQGCQAYQQQAVFDYPKRDAKRKQLPIRATSMLLLVDEAGRYLLERRPRQGIWGGLWCFPSIDDWRAEHAAYQQAMGLHWVSRQKLATFRHTFSHYHLMITPVQIQVRRQTRSHPASPPWQDSARYHWYDLADEMPGGIPKPVQQLLQQQRSLFAAPAE